MAKDSPGEGEHLQRFLADRAVALFGEERAQVLAPMIAETAEALTTIAAQPPDREEEPAYWE